MVSLKWSWTFFSFFSQKEGVRFILMTAGAFLYKLGAYLKIIEKKLRRKKLKTDWTKNFYAETT